MHWPSGMKLSEESGRLRQAGQTFFNSCRRLGARAWPFAKAGKFGFNSDTNGIGAAVARPLLEAGNLATRLTEEKEFLLALIRGMETEFLATGEGLGRLAQQLNEIQRECRSLTDMTLGRGLDAPVQLAFQLLKKSEDLVLASYEQYDHVFATFNELQRRLAQLSKQQDELMRVLLPLNFITISFRIEASRHPPEVQQAFFTLADNVNRTVGEVRGTLERQFEDLAASERIARKLMEQISASIQRHRRKVTATLETSRNHLRALNGALTNSGSGATDLFHRNKAVTLHIGGIVMAQQCQDITRQRIEHVGEAMDEMRMHLGEAPTTAFAANSEERQFVFRAGQIQLHQVQNAFDQLNCAADSLKSGIQSLRTEAGSAAEVAVKVGGTTLDASIASQCQAGIDEILGIVRQAVQKIADIIAAFEPLQASFVDCTSKASALASDVRRAGLNAQVFAIHAPNGATLEVLADRMRAISEEVIEQVGQMGAALNHTTEMVNNLRQRLEDFQIIGQAEQEILTDESALSQSKLLELEDAIPLLIRRVTQQQDAFGRSVETVLANVRFPETVADANARAVGFFQDLVRWGGEGGSAMIAGAASERIDLLKASYTMDSERHAHAAASEPMLASASAIAADSAFEMFDDFALPVPTVTGSLGDSPLHEGPKVKLHPPRPATVENLPPEPAPAPAPTKSAASEELGDNVDLF